MDNKVVLVTGSSRGIGKATIIEFASRGYNVVIDYITSEREAELKFINDKYEFDNEKDANDLKSYIETNYDVKALVINMDVSKENEVKEGIKKIIDTFGRLDVVVNSAGIVFDRDMYDATVDEFINTLSVNVMGAFLVSREASKYMKSGSIIIISSTNGSRVVAPESIDYNISKIGLQSLTRDLAYQLKPNIRVNAIAIGWADTDMNKDLPKDYVDEEKNKIYVERFADPKEIAKTIYFLANDEASYINSEVVTIDGGYY